MGWAGADDDNVADARQQLTHKTDRFLIRPLRVILTV
jgi:hypothetical protein